MGASSCFPLSPQFSHAKRSHASHPGIELEAAPLQGLGPWRPGMLGGGLPLLKCVCGTYMAERSISLAAGLAGHGEGCGRVYWLCPGHAAAYVDELRGGRRQCSAGVGDPGWLRLLL